jgi:F-type H+-transporting ATPase subunit a
VSRACRRLRRLLLPAGPVLLLALVLAPLQASAATTEDDTKFNPVHEFLLEPYFHLKVGPLDFGPTKAVVYMLISATVAIVATLLILRGGFRRQPGRAQTVVETVYAFLETNVGAASLPKKAFDRWFPYVSAIFIFIWTINLISFIPLPFNTEYKVHGVPGLAIYAATSNISVTLALALMTILISHVEGIRANGVVGYFKSWIPPSPTLLKIVLVPLETLSQLVRIVSLSVRLFANMLAGHLLIILCIGMSLLVGHFVVGFIAVPVGAAFYVLEVGLVASLQAYIFALLSGIYIGGAIEPAHH